MGRASSLRQKAWVECRGICFLCGLAMLPDTEQGNPLAFTLEHIIPKSKGGTNDLTNLSGSHSYCNNYKQDNLMEELPAGYRPVLRWKIRNLLINQKVGLKKEKE